MNIPVFTLFGFLFTTLCTSICPMGMNMAMMPMDMGDMHMVAQEMGQDTAEKEMPCKKCETNSKLEISALSSTSEIKNVSTMQIAYVPITSTHLNRLHSQKIRLKNVINGPPPLSVSLVGTVVFRT